MTKDVKLAQSAVLIDTKDAIECTLHYLKTGDGPARWCVERLTAALRNLENHTWAADSKPVDCICEKPGCQEFEGAQ